MEKITRRAKNLALCYGASVVGIATTETLKGGPPSTDLSYVLPNAKSAVSFALPLDQNHIEPWFNKQSHEAHFRNNIQANVIASGISLELANYLEQKGYPSVPLTANSAYRSDTKNGRYDEKPLISHRYLAVRSGVGFFGLSGNVLTKTDGATIILGSVVTEAELIPTDPIPAEDNYCDDCRLCKAACASGYIDGEERVAITMGGMEFSYSKKHNHSYGYPFFSIDKTGCTCSLAQSTIVTIIIFGRYRFSRNELCLRNHGTQDDGGTNGFCKNVTG